MSAIDEVIRVQKVMHFGTIKRILNKCSYMFTRFVDATIEQDTKEGFDAIFSFPDVKIPIRIRNYESQKYLDLTIRSKALYGGKTEIDKMKEGFGDYYFYCWLDSSNKVIDKYAILDLKIFRKSLINYPSCTKPNTDGTEFMCYRIDALMKNDVLIIYESIRR